MGDANAIENKLHTENHVHFKNLPLPPLPLSGNYNK